MKKNPTVYLGVSADIFHHGHINIINKSLKFGNLVIGLLTDKITKLSDHFKKFKKDKHSTLGLTKSVNKRKKLLTYLKKKNVESYQKVIKQLNLRK